MSAETPSTTTTPSSPTGKRAWEAILDDNPSSPNAPLSSTTPAAPAAPVQPAGGTPTQGTPAGVSPAGQGGSPPAAPVTPADPAAPITPNNIIQMDTAAVRELISSVVPQAPAPAGKQYTQEELDTIFNVVKVAEAHLHALGIEPTPERLKTMNDLLQGTSRQAATVAEFRLMQAVESLKAEIGQQLGPVLAHYQTQATEQLKSRFYGAYPHLKDYEPILLKVRDSFKAQGRRFNSEDEAFKAVAEEAQALLATLKITPVQSQGGQPTTVAPANNGHQPSNMPTLSGGGQGGAGDANKTSGQKPKWQAIFE